MTLRKHWEFKYKASDVIQSVERKLNYHKEREVFWTAERDATRLAMKEKGCELREYPVTGGTQINFVTDPDLSNRYSHCFNRIRFHQLKTEEYTPWHLVLSANPNQQLELDHEDIMFFGLGNDKEEEEE